MPQRVGHVEVSICTEHDTQGLLKTTAPGWNEYANERSGRAVITKNLKFVSKVEISVRSKRQSLRRHRVAARREDTKERAG